MLKKQDLIMLRDYAKQVFVNLPPGFVLPGSKKELDEEERLLYSTYRAAFMMINSKGGIKEEFNKKRLLILAKYPNGDIPGE